MTTMFRREKPRTFKKDSGGQSIQNRHTSPKKFFIWFEFFVFLGRLVLPLVFTLSFFVDSIVRWLVPIFILAKNEMIFQDDIIRLPSILGKYGISLPSSTGKKPPIYTPPCIKQVLTLYISLSVLHPEIKTMVKHSG